MKKITYICYVVLYRGDKGGWNFSTCVPGIFLRRKDAAAQMRRSDLSIGVTYRIVRMEYEVPA